MISRSLNTKEAKLFVGIICLALSGCATQPGQVGQFGFGPLPWPSASIPTDSNRAYTPIIGRHAAINGIQLTETSPDAFPMGKFQGFLQMTSKADFAALNGMSLEYAAAAWDAASRQDWEGFAVNRRLGMRITEYRVHQKIATTAFVDSLSSRSDGSGILAPGSTIFLPGFTRWGADQQRTASSKYQSQLFSANIQKPDWANAPKTADASDVFNLVRTASDVLTGKKMPVNNIAQAKSQAGDLLSQLPEHAVFSAHDSAGNTFLVERTKEGFLVGNPGGRPVIVPLAKLGFVPDMPEPNEVRRNAGPLALRMQEVRHKFFWQAMGTTGTRILATTQSPNKVFIQNTRVSGLFDADGNLASNAITGQSGVSAYQTNPSYRLALDMVNFAGHENQEFKGQCNQLMRGVAYDTNYLGENAEILRHECFDNTKYPLISRDFYVLDGKTMQTFESLMKDRNLAEKLKHADTNRDLAESVIGFVPTIGNIDSASKCLTGTALSSYTAIAASKMRGGNEAYRAFVSDLLPPSQEPSVLAKSLTCASAIPAFGTATRVLAKTGNWMNGYRNWLATERAQGLFKTMDFFDTNIFGRGNTARFSEMGALSKQSMDTLKRFYDSMQTVSAGQGLVSSTASVFTN